MYEPISADDLPEDPKERRRAINRRSQAKTRKHRDDLLFQLQAESERLKVQLEAAKRAEASAAAALSTTPNPLLSSGKALSSSDSSSLSPPSGQLRVPNGTLSSAYGSGPQYVDRSVNKRAGVDVDACKIAFVTALVAVCAPHLNTIHHVCELFVKARHAEPPPYYSSAGSLASGSSPHSSDTRGAAQHSADDNEGWPALGHIHSGSMVNHSITSISPDYAASSNTNVCISKTDTGTCTAALWPIESNVWAGKPLPELPAVQHAISSPANGFNQINYDIQSFQFADLNSTAYIPPLGFAGPLSVPYLEPQHPITGEVDVEGIWTRVLLQVDLKSTDLEYLAVKMCPKVRCYGQGPTMLMNDVDDICGGMDIF